MAPNRFSKSFWTCDLISAPYCSSKASDTVLLVKWVHRFISLNILNPIVDGYAEVLRQIHLWCYPWTQQNIEPWAVDAHLFYMNYMTFCGYAAVDGGPLRWSPSTAHYTFWAFMFEDIFCRKPHLRVILLWQAAMSTRTFSVVSHSYLGVYRFRLVDLRGIQTYFLKIKSILRKRNEQAKRPTRMGVKRHIKKWCNREQWFQTFQW